MDWLDLPELCLIRVLNFLPVRDRLNARLVCRHWKLTTDSSVQRNELILFLEIYPRPVYWLDDEREADLGNAFLVTKLASLKNEFFLRHFRKLRRLMIVHGMYTPSEQFIEKIQASFRELEHLQFYFLGDKTCFSGMRIRVYEKKVSLPNLRTFYSQAGDMPLELDCPRLTELYVLSHLTIGESTDDQTKMCIQNLRFLLVEQLTYPRDFQFTNLEIFYFNKPGLIHLSDFPRLKEIHYFNPFIFVYFELEDHLENLLEQKRELKRDQLKVYFDGFELVDATDLETLKTYVPSHGPLLPLWGLDLNEPVLRLIKRGSPICKLNLLSKDLLMSDQLDDELADLAEDDELGKSFLKSVKQISFEQPLLKKSFNLFDLSCRFRHVSSVSITVELSQVLLEKLANALPDVVDFYHHPKFFGKHFLNFKFIAKFRSLKRFGVHCNLISIEEVRFILENCKFISSFAVHRENLVRVRMFRSIGGKDFVADWLSSDGQRFACAKFTREQLLDYLESSRWFEKNSFLGEREKEKQAELLIRRDED